MDPTKKRRAADRPPKFGSVGYSLSGGVEAIAAARAPPRRHRDGLAGPDAQAAASADDEPRRGPPPRLWHPMLARLAIRRLTSATPPPLPGIIMPPLRGRPTAARRRRGCHPPSKSSAGTGRAFTHERLRVVLSHTGLDPCRSSVRWRAPRPRAVIGARSAEEARRRRYCGEWESAPGPTKLPDAHAPRGRGAVDEAASDGRICNRARCVHGRQRALPEERRRYVPTCRAIGPTRGRRRRRTCG